MKAKTFDRKFDAADKIIDQLDLTKASRIGTDPKRVNVDFPAWMVDSLDLRTSWVRRLRRSTAGVDPLPPLTSCRFGE
jgi:hypothetical protein